MEEDFYASLKLITGEEIFARVSPSEENGNLVIILFDPIIIDEVKTRYGYAYKVEPWMKTTKDDIFVIEMRNVITMTETTDLDIITAHETYVKKKIKDNISMGINHFELTKEMGYVSNIKEAKEKLEKIFKSNKDS
jgi:hypothetical protein